VTISSCAGMTITLMWAGRVPVAQYVHDIVEVDGLRFPTKRRAYVRGPGLKPIRDLLISLDMSDFRLAITCEPLEQAAPFRSLGWGSRSRALCRHRLARRLGGPVAIG
jgi:hypothetical protein